MLKSVENKYTTAKNFCFAKEIKIHCKKLVKKKNGKDKRRILKGTIAGIKSTFIKENKGDKNQNGKTITTDDIKNTKK